MFDREQESLAGKIAGINAGLERSAREADVPRLMNLLGDRRRMLEAALATEQADAEDIAAALRESAGASRRCLRILRAGMETARERIETVVRGRGALSLLRGGSDGESNRGRLVNGRG